MTFSVELIQTNPQMFNDGQPRRSSDTSMQSTVSGLIDNVPITTITARMLIFLHEGSSMIYCLYFSPTTLVGFKTT